MNPEEVGINYEIDNRNSGIQEQATQTNGPTDSKLSLRKYPKLPLPRDIEKDDTITVYEYCVLEYETPQSVSIIKEKIIESKRDQPSISNSDTWTSYRYHKEIIQPCLRYPPGCPISDDRIFVNSSIETDLTEDKQSKEESSQTVNYDSKISKADVATSCVNLTMDKENKVFVSKTTSSTENTDSSVNKEDFANKTETKKDNTIKTPLSLDIITPPSQWSFFKRNVSEEQTKPGSSTPEKEEVTEAENVPEEPSKSPNTILSTVSIIKSIVDKVYKKDNLITENTEQEQNTEEINEEKKSLSEKYPALTEVLHNAINKVDSTVSNLSNNLSKSYEALPKKFKLKDYNNDSSPYDIPKGKSGHNFEEPVQETSVFSTIKSKFCSMFYESNSKSKSSHSFDDEGKDKAKPVIDKLID